MVKSGAGGTCPVSLYLPLDLQQGALLIGMEKVMAKQIPAAADRDRFLIRRQEIGMGDERPDFSGQLADQGRSNSSRL